MTIKVTLPDAVGTGVIVAEQKIKVVGGAMSMRYNNVEATRGVYRLPQKSVGFYTKDATGKRAVVADRLPKLTLQVVGIHGEAVGTPYAISLEENLVHV